MAGWLHDDTLSHPSGHRQFPRHAGRNTLPTPSRHPLTTRVAHHGLRRGGLPHGQHHKPGEGEGDGQRGIGERVCMGHDGIGCVMAAEDSTQGSRGAFSGWRVGWGPWRGGRVDAQGRWEAGGCPVHAT